MNCTDLLSHLSDYFDEQLSPKLLEEIRTHKNSPQNSLFEKLLLFLRSFCCCCCFCFFGISAGL